MTSFSRTGRRSLRRGFTLIELIVALTIGIIVLVGARAILEQLADTADWMTAAASQADRAANTDRTIHAFFEHTVAADSAHPFWGDGQSLRFSSWCDMPAGWAEPCTITVSVGSDGHEDASPDMSSASVRSDTTKHRPPLITVSTSEGDTLYLGNRARARLAYLVDAAGGGQWTEMWHAGVTTPLAVGVMTEHDTIVFRIGERR